MKFDFFTFGGRFVWEDVLNYQNWIIQRNIHTQKYRFHNYWIIITLDAIPERLKTVKQHF